MGSIVSSILDPFTGASGVRQAGEQAAAQQREAGVTAANISAFRPVGMTTRFGTSQFTREVDPRTGVPYISSAGYTAAPELSALQNQLFGRFAPTLAQAEQVQGQYAPLTGATERLFNLGQQYLATSPEQAAQDYVTSQQALLAPSRQAQLSNVRSGLFARGRGGLGVQTGTGSAPASPEMQAYYNALAQQDLQLAANAQQAGQQRAQFGAGLFGTGAGLLGTQVQGQAGAYSPLLAALGVSGQVEQMSQMPYQLGLQLGSAQMPGQQTGSQQYYGGQVQGAQTQLGANMAAQQMNNQFLSSLIGAASGNIGGGGGGGGTPGMWNTSMPYTNVTRGYDPWSAPSDYSYSQQSYGGLF
jgi:hypothetical protein